MSPGRWYAGRTSRRAASVAVLAVLAVLAVSAGCAQTRNAAHGLAHRADSHLDRPRLADCITALPPATAAAAAYGLHTLWLIRPARPHDVALFPAGTGVGQPGSPSASATAPSGTSAGGTSSSAPPETGTPETGTSGSGSGKSSLSCLVTYTGTLTSGPPPSAGSPAPPGLVHRPAYLVLIVRVRPPAVLDSVLLDHPPRTARR